MTKSCKPQRECREDLKNSTSLHPPWWPSLLCTCAIGAASVLIGWFLGGKYLAEKTATLLAMPLGLAWLILAGRVLHLLLVGALLRHKALLTLWLAMWCLTTSPLSYFLTRYLESRVETYNPERDQPLDVVVVLGGGTSMGPWRAQADEAGDRVVLGAELYLTGKTRQLVATGDSAPGLSASHATPAQHAVEIWTKLGIPRSSIQTLPGLNTSEEIRNLKRTIGDLAGPRVGLLTSGTHIARAVRLARAANLEVVPIASDVKSERRVFRYLDIFPRAHAVYRLSLCQHELMAALFSR